MRYFEYIQKSQANTRDNQGYSIRNNQVLYEHRNGDCYHKEQNEDGLLCQMDNTLHVSNTFWSTRYCDIVYDRLHAL